MSEWGENRKRAMAVLARVDGFDMLKLTTKFKLQMRNIWSACKQRCYNPKHPKYENYGGRGIGVCEEWATDFWKFVEEMAPTYRRGWTLERMDVNGDYSRKNCIWIDKEWQAKNRTTTHWVFLEGYGTLILADAARIMGMSPETVRKRIEAGWPESRWFEPAQTKHAVVPYEPKNDKRKYGKLCKNTMVLTGHDGTVLLDKKSWQKAGLTRRDG